MPIPCKHCPHCETCSPTNIGAVCKPKAKTKSEIIKDVCQAAGIEVFEIPLSQESDPLDSSGLVNTNFVELQTVAIDAYAQAIEQDRLFAQRMMKTMTPEQINRFCFENGYSVPEPKKIWVVKYSALFAAGGQPSGQFNVSAADEQEARTKAHQVIKAISKESGVDSFNLNISDDVIPERKVTTNPHMYAPYGKPAAPRAVEFNPNMYAAYGKSSKPCKPNQGQLVVARRMVEALQDGECPCCHGSWPSADATACNGCGYRLDEE